MTELPPYLTVGVITGDSCSFTYSWSHVDSSIWPKISNFDLSAQGLYSTVMLSSLWVSWPIGTFWHSFASSTVVSWQQASKSLLLKVDVEIFLWYWFCCKVMFGAVCLLSRKLVILLKLSSTFVVAFGQQALLLVLFCLVSSCLITV